MTTHPLTSERRKARPRLGGGFGARAFRAVAGTAATALVGAFSVVAYAQAVNVSVDATAPGTTLERVWAYHGYDEVNYTTTAEGRALLSSLAAAHTAPIHVRTHFLLNTGNGTASLKWGSTNAYTEDAAGNPVYSWTLMDGIMDAITAAKAFPFVEIAFMPQALSTRPTPYMIPDPYSFDTGAFYPPRDYTKWGNLITEWATHVNARYPNVAGSWLWELWNEPDISYWHGTFAEYARLYDVTEAAVHAVLPTAPVGGPAVASVNNTFLGQFLQHCATGANAVTGGAGTRLDLISFHAKGGAAVTGGHVRLDLGNQLRLHRTGFGAVAAIPMYRQTPIHITEADPDGCAACPASMFPADAYRNSPAYGAYEVAMMKATIDLAASLGVNLDGVLTWAFTFPGSPYFAGYRALTTNGINLPVMGAFKLLGSLEGTRLAVTSSGAVTLASILAGGVRGAAPDVDAMATLNGRRIQVLVWNYHDDLVAAPAAMVQLSVRVPAAFGARVTVNHLRVDETHGDAYTVWTSQGSPAAPSALQIAALRQAMDPAPLDSPATVNVAGGSASVSFALPRFGISLLTLDPEVSADASADAPGVDGSVPDAAPDMPGADARLATDVADPSDALGDAAASRDAATDPPQGGGAGTGGAMGAGDAAGPDSAASNPGNGGGCACSIGDASISGRASPARRLVAARDFIVALAFAALGLAARPRPRRRARDDQNRV